MLALIITILRGLFLILLYLFIFRLTVSMIERFNQSTQEDELPNVAPLGMRIVPKGGDGAALQVISSGEAGITPGVTFRLGDLTKLGRGRDNHILLSGSYASQEHAHISYMQGQYWIEDLDSLNKTYLNEVPITKPTVLANNDRIRIGEVIFQFVRWAYEMESDN